jgi:group I intron endonuclease
VYIGSAVDIKRRWQDHSSSLQRGVHENPYLQRAWNKYGESAFSFEVVEKVPDYALLIPHEQVWLDQIKSFDRKVGYNICPRARSRLGVRASEEQKLKQRRKMTGRKLSTQHRQRVGEGSKQSWANSSKDRHRALSVRTLGAKNPMFGKHHAEEVKLMASYYGRLSGHNRYHRDRAVISPKCEFCQLLKV